MPGLQGETAVAALGSPVKKNKLSLKFFQKKEAKRALDFSEPQPDEPKTSDPVEQDSSSCDQVVPGPLTCPPSPSLLLSAEKKENLVPFIGFNNLGNTCYLNSVLQVLYYCPGLREGIKKLFSLCRKKEKPKDKNVKTEEVDTEEEPVLVHMDLLCSFNSLIMSVEQLQSSFLLSPDGFTESDLATPPRKILNTLRQLNPMYEGYLQHDAQEVLQCILGYLHEACDTIRKEQDLEEENTVSDVKPENSCATDPKSNTEEDGQINGKRKSDTEAGNAKKKPKSVKCKTPDGEDEASGSKIQTRSKRKSSSDVPIESAQRKAGEKEAANVDGINQEEESEKATKETENKRKKRPKLGWLRSSKKTQNDKQPSIFSKFRSVGRISSTTAKNQVKAEAEEDKPSENIHEEKSKEEPTSETKEVMTANSDAVLDLMERLFQGQLVLRTRCLECESFTERREDFQDISVPVLDEQPPSPEDLSEVSPDPKPELKTLNWAIGQFASVEHIFGEDKYFCETCRHYTEAERSLLFDKTPEVITIHLKRFSANSLELDLYGGLCKVNTPLQTPLTLCLDEWCTQRSAKGQTYELFAVIMHSGVTISSGHYTAYVRMSDLKDVKLRSSDEKKLDQEKTEEVEKDIKTETNVKGEALDYDDGEVSFNVNSRGQRGQTLAKTCGKKLPEGGVGLLGGQRSLSACELGNKKSDKSANSRPSEGSKRRKTVGSVGQNTDAGLKHEDGTEVHQADSKASETKVLDSLLEYEGKWMLFDDSEVRMFDEEEFLRACSPETSSSSTPYLLFYRRKS